MTLKKFKHIFLLATFLLCPLSVNAEGIDPQYEQKLKDAKYQIMLLLNETKDKKERLKLVQRLRMLYDANYHPDVRSLKVKRTHPEWATEVEKDKGLTQKDIELELMRQFEERVLLSPYVEVAHERHWPKLTKVEKTVVCKYASQNCETDRFMNCNFVVDRCRPYIDENIYNEILLKTGRGAREER